MKTILVADDEAHLRLLVKTTLDDADYRIIEAPDGDAALQMALAEKPDLLVLDWMMPGRSGIDVLEALREKPETGNMPVIMLTAKSQSLDRQRAVLLGIRGYLVKPFSPLELLELVEKVLQGERVTA